jgi:hypothetical protein
MVSALYGCAGMYHKYKYKYQPYLHMEHPVFTDEAKEIRDMAVQPFHLVSRKADFGRKK